MKITFCFILVLLAGCSNKGMYEAMTQNQCLETTGKIYCDNDGASFEDYEREREALLKEK